MSLFDKRKIYDRAEHPGVDDRYDTEPAPRGVAMIGETIRIKGDVTGDENLIIDGNVEGTVHLANNDLTVGETGHVIANLAANVVRIDGEVQGDIVGVEKVVITKTGNVEGNIVCPRVTLEEGAKFRGSIEMDPTIEDQVPVMPPSQGPRSMTRRRPTSGEEQAGEEKGKASA